MFYKFLNGVHIPIQIKFGKSDNLFFVFIASVFAHTKIKNGSNLKKLETLQEKVM